MLELSGQWALQQAGGTVAAPMRLPGDAISALMDAGHLPDPYAGLNEYDCRWVGESDWVLSRSFTHDGSASALEISELDCVAEIWLNGRQVLAADNQHRRYRADVSAALVAGENHIEIRFASNARVAAERAAAQPWPVPFSKDNNPIAHGNMLRKVHCDFGWDWGIALAPFGVYGDIRLVPLEQVALRDVLVVQHHSAGRVVLEISLLLNQPASNVACSASICGQAAQASAQNGRAELQITIENPTLWWPAGAGNAVLHALDIQVGDTTASRRIGLRDLRLITKADAAGTGFKFNINGRDIFAKGANWIPADALPSRIEPAAVRAQLQSARDANMNMIRVWGGGRYERDWFYDLCDELGLMVWQDFMFACHLYPADPAFLAGIDAEVRDVVARISHHACLALWCGDNEVIGALTWYEEARKNRDRYLVAYDRLNRTIETALRETLPSAAWWPSSPSAGVMDFSDGWHDDGAGDMHFWSVWHEGKDFEHYRTVRPRFASEFGFQAFPSLEVIRQFALGDDMNVNTPVMESHQKNAGGNTRIAETMLRYFRYPAGFENFVYLSQLQQALAIKTAVEYWRCQMPHCMGTLFWQLNDVWPCVSWSSLNYGGAWKLLHYFAKLFYAPVAVHAVPKGVVIQLIAVNDTAADMALEVQGFTADMAGATRPKGQQSAVIAAGQTGVMLEIPLAQIPTGAILAFTWKANGQTGGDIFSPVPFKRLALQNPQLGLAFTARGDMVEITLTAAALALFVTLECPAPGRFSQNGFALFPGHPATITFTPENGDAATAARQITSRNLWASSHEA
ncbi:glycoside hydrolase family 2 protein [Abyssibius alkaniclasticus]|uniref:beta-mannosidase n=1 Tax=Abyssibius alkaniclasticus TaxID=2881234 RepID=UPI0023645DDE|nr:glycoside hydrolase family 2 protein [Abyssibius alkaniclasticus]UPH69798.1 glycoside hydrolase family 2 protein [Abyssibius alkaniclasticus]